MKDEMKKLTQRNNRQYTALIRQEDTIKILITQRNALQVELAALRAERDELRETLKTIADTKNWHNRNGEIVWNDCEGNEFIPEHAQEIARAVLAKYEAQ